MDDNFGKGIIKGLGVSLKRFLETYLDDLTWIGRRYGTEKGIAHRASKDARGIFTVQYPEEKIRSPRVPFVPFLVYRANGEQMRCTSCGICAGMPPTVHLIVSTDPPPGADPDPAQYLSMAISA
jgi:NADH-quinone oxidoreductase subunit I